ncbi:MAG: RsmD family RNA methyltransferase [Candidatus Saccharibacteria bacterium]|nr:RsmD family RNA methyltransferase [Candidatus Saccharibacteria bacterium]
MRRTKNSGGFVKITGGDLKGRKIRTPGGGTHPMGERERIALFNILGERVAGATVLDAFAGSGILGMEALSRYASKVIFVEKNSVTIHGIIDTCLWLGISEEKVDFYHGTVASFCKKMVDSGMAPDWTINHDSKPQGFDVVLADPPYDAFDLSEIEHLGELVKKDGILVLSHPGEAPNLQGMELIKTRTYARAHISIYSKN